MVGVRTLLWQRAVASLLYFKTANKGWYDNISREGSSLSAVVLTACTGTETLSAST